MAYYDALWDVCVVRMPVLPFVSTTSYLFRNHATATCVMGELIACSSLSSACSDECVIGSSCYPGRALPF